MGPNAKKFAPFGLTLVISLLLMIIVGMVVAYTRLPLKSLTADLKLPPDYVVEPGIFRILDTNVCAKLGNCFGNNPDSPYGRPIFAGTKGADLDDAGILIGAWSLAQDQAVVLFGLLPPQVRYWGWTLYLFDRDAATTGPPSVADPSKSSAGTEKALPGRVVSFASLGDTINLQETQTAPLAPFVLVVTRNPLVAAKLKEVAKNPIFAAKQRKLMVLQVPEQVKSTDRLMLVLRTAFFSSEAERLAFIETPNIKAVRVTVPLTPSEKMGTYKLTRGMLRQRPMTPMEGMGDVQAAQVEELLGLAKAKGYTATELGVNPFLKLIDYDSGLDCIDNNVQCLGDNRDSTYTLTGAPVQMGAAEMLLVVGVNHTLSGKATYTTLSVYDNDTQSALGSISDQDMGGDRTYAVLVSRDGSNPLAEGNVKSLNAPLSSASLRVSERAYVEPSSGVGPNPATISMPRVFLLRPGTGSSGRPIKNLISRFLGPGGEPIQGQSDQANETDEEISEDRLLGRMVPPKPWW